MTTGRFASALPPIFGSALFSGTAMANIPILCNFEFFGTDKTLLVGTRSDADIRVVAAGATAPGLDASVLLGSRGLGLGRLCSIVQLGTDQTCNAHGGCNVRVLHSSPNGYLTVADAMAIDVAWISGGSEPVTLLFVGLQGPAIWRWNGSADAFDCIGDNDLMDACYPATGGNTH